MDMNAHFKVRDDVLEQDVDGELVLLDLSGETYFGLNPVAARIWTLLRQGRSIAAVQQALFDEFEVEAPRLEADVKSTVAALLERDLIKAGECA